MKTNINSFFAGSLTALLLLFCCYATLTAQEDFNQVLSEEGVYAKTFYSSTAKDSFTLKVSLPFGYQTAKSTYPVLYILDSNVSFGMVNDITKLLYFENNYPVIVVGIGYVNFREWISKRQRDYTPTANNTQNVERFYEMLTTEAMPIVNKNFKTNTDKQILYGHSSAALFGLYTLFTHKNTFGNYILTSPSLNEDGGFIKHLESKYSEANKELAATVYLSIGSGEDQKLKGVFQAFSDTVKARQYQGHLLKEEVLKGTHMSTMPVGFVNGFGFIVKNQK